MKLRLGGYRVRPTATTKINGLGTPVGQVKNPIRLRGMRRYLSEMER